MRWRLNGLILSYVPTDKKQTGLCKLGRPTSRFALVTPLYQEVRAVGGSEFRLRQVIGSNTPSPTPPPLVKGGGRVERPEASPLIHEGGGCPHSGQVGGGPTLSLGRGAGEWGHSKALPRNLN